uniref:Pterin-binding domain-containing protein n=1 Tax=Zooxanthella nutricula TaxID=1333877 RepID=A0A7S2QPK1_9DINO
MARFLSLCAKDSNVAPVPFMLSSDSWPVIEAGLRSVQGKCIVNAASLVQGEHELLCLAKACQRYGAALVVMAVESMEEDWVGVGNKVSIAKRCYRLLRSKLDFPAEDIIFDCGLAPVGGPWAHPGAAADVLGAIEEIRRECPGVSLAAGLGNLSVACRGLEGVRTAMHSVFLRHAVPKGLNLAIADPGRLPRHSDLEPATLQACEDLLLDPSGDHSQKFEEFVTFLRGHVAERGPVAGVGAQVAVPEQALPLALAPVRKRPSPSARRYLETLVQTTGTTNASLFTTFGSKAHAADTFHRLTHAAHLKRSVLFSSISAYMGQGGSGPVPGASSFLDNVALWERHQGLNGMVISVQWGAIGEIGLRRAIYGDRDVFAQFDLGQKLIGPADTQKLQRELMSGSTVPEFIGLAYLDASWQNQLGGYTTGAGAGAQVRSTFADN